MVLGYITFYIKLDSIGWRAKMKAFLKKYGVWEIVINAANPSKKKNKAEAQKEAKKNNATTLKFLLDSLPSSIRDSLGEFTSARELWLKLEEDYQGKVQGKQLEDEHETKPNHIHEEVDQALAKDEMNLIKDSLEVEEMLKRIMRSSNKKSTYFPTSRIMEIHDDKLTEVKDQVVKASQQNEQRLKEVKDLLRRLKDEYNCVIPKMDEKDGEINRLQEEVADEANLESQLEEARKKEEVLKDQLEKKDEALQR